jgi:hypothetical protein
MADVIPFPTKVVRDWTEIEESARGWLRSQNAGAELEAHLVERLKAHYQDLQAVIPRVTIDETLPTERSEAVKIFAEGLSYALLAKALGSLFVLEREVYLLNNRGPVAG